jgi:hypothetical protein
LTRNEVPKGIRIEEKCQMQPRLEKICCHSMNNGVSKSIQGRSFYNVNNKIPTKK